MTDGANPMNTQEPGEKVQCAYIQQAPLHQSIQYQDNIAVNSYLSSCFWFTITFDHFTLNDTFLCLLLYWNIWLYDFII